MSLSYPKKETYDVNDLLSIMRALRSPEGCPWDKEQTHESIRQNFLEETHEAIEAIDNGDKDGLREELGDVMMQVVFHAIMEEEVGGFTFDDVVDELCKKLIVRHPHVFGDVKATNEAEALKSWDAMKRATKKTNAQSDLLKNVPKTLPALMRAEKVQDRARRVGFDYDGVEDALAALDGEVAELKAEIVSGDTAAQEDELGDVLFSVVNVARFLKIEPELALGKSVEKFVRRFSALDKLAAERNIDVPEASLDTLNALWDEVKRAE